MMISITGITTTCNAETGPYGPARLPIRQSVEDNPLHFLSCLRGNGTNNSTDMSNDKPTNIIEAWLYVATIGGQLSIDTALRELENEVEELTGQRPVIEHSLLSRWRRGKRTPSPAVLLVMARHVAALIVERVAAASGLPADTVIDDADVEAIARMSVPPLRE